MRLDLSLFDMMFPTYSSYRIPMWSKWKNNETDVVLEVAIPGFTKNDFVLYVEDGSLTLKINSEKQSLSYSIMDSYYASNCKLEKATAEYTAGILKISIPKVKSKRTTIEVS